jgi:hypothetical protein
MSIGWFRSSECIWRTAVVEDYSIIREVDCELPRDHQRRQPARINGKKRPRQLIRNSDRRAEVRSAPHQNARWIPHLPRCGQRSKSRIVVDWAARQERTNWGDGGNARDCVSDQPPIQELYVAYFVGSAGSDSAGRDES